MSTPSASKGSASGEAEGSAPDVSLVAEPAPSESGGSYSHRGLTYPLGRTGPGPGEIISLADGVGWMRLPVPGSLNHINIWILDDGDGVAIVDTGLAIDVAREAWEAIFAGPLAGRAVTRIICTHFHPDHVGLAGWLTHRFAVPLWMTRGEWLFVRMLTADVRDAPPDEAIAQWRAAGWSDQQIAAESEKGWGRFASVVSPLPLGYVRIQDGDEIRIGARSWRVVVGSGHCPEHACLVEDEARLMISGDQVLPRITSNVSMSLSEPMADPLGEWLASIARLKQLSDELLILPSHGEPFTGLHARLDALRDGHLGRLDALHVLLAEPRRVPDCFTTLFGRPIGDDIFGLAAGEAMAHLRHLEVEGRAVRENRDGVHWFRAA